MYVLDFTELLINVIKLILQIYPRAHQQFAFLAKMLHKVLNPPENNFILQCVRDQKFKTF